MPLCSTRPLSVCTTGRPACKKGAWALDATGRPPRYDTKKKSKRLLGGIERRRCSARRNESALRGDAQGGSYSPNLYCMRGNASPTVSGRKEMVDPFSRSQTFVETREPRRSTCLCVLGARPSRCWIGVVISPICTVEYYMDAMQQHAARERRLLPCDVLYEINSTDAWSAKQPLGPLEEVAWVGFTTST